ncbi:MULTISPECIES: DUF2937 family protein [Roseobacteraceae]|uniref:Prolyl-tRNA synthetase n=1 Tax=Pseudosulfitobacter pseudonitzschiae TaxID=1402135 RepID=A0A221JY35_9RHOB|nr:MULTISPECIES: DUF2937 family protein [Roseobacteraceae]ASM71507.1 hypothetical protein SULPSESMR1_00675 [Pseudosulfitobacter pseudonitzschiae]
MIVRTLTLVAALTAGAATSQFPEFSQQYAQRLGGAVDALAEVVADFDASAQAEGLTRVAALNQMQGTPFIDRRRADMIRTFARYDKLRADLAALDTAGPFMRAYHATRMTDPEVARAAWAAFQPALPLTFAGGIFAGVGFITMLLAIGILRLLLPTRRRRTA